MFKNELQYPFVWISFSPNDVKSSQQESGDLMRLDTGVPVQFTALCLSIASNPIFFYTTMCVFYLNVCSPVVKKIVFQIL